MGLDRPGRRAGFRKREAPTIVKPGDPQTRSKEAMEPLRREGRSAGPDPGREAAVRELVAHARAGDQAAYRELVEMHQDRAYGLALRITRSPADAEEVAQDAFVRAWLALARFRGESSFATWLHRIVARRALDRLSELKTRRAREVPGDEAADPPDRAGGAAHGDAGAAMRSRRLERLVAGLPQAQRMAITLYYYEDRSVEQAATILGLPENTVKTHLARARAALRDALRREDL
jgi:RNA polymerase sigma-70 factor (ECF subfamily)